MLLQEEEVRIGKQLDDERVVWDREKAAYAADLDDSLMGACCTSFCNPLPFCF